MLEGEVNISVMGKSEYECGICAKPSYVADRAMLFKICGIFMRNSLEKDPTRKGQIKRSPSVHAEHSYDMMAFQPKVQDVAIIGRWKHNMVVAKLVARSCS